MPVSKQYVSTGSRGQDSPTLFFQNSKNKTASYTSAIIHLCIELQTLKGGVMLRVMVFNATFNNITFISWRSVLLVEETGVPGEKHRPAASH
jgi:hypothetical protein